MDLGNLWKALTNGNISTEYGTQLDYIQKHWHESEYYLKENHNEQEPTDNVEPKFNVGDWVIADFYFLCSPLKIVDISDTEYRMENTKGNSVVLKIDYIDKHYHLWTIQDAKDGDVLVASDRSIFIFAGLVDNLCKYHVAITAENNVIINKEVKKHSWEKSDVVHPTTKEQRDLLFAKMKERGYEWDNDKKELKKIERNHTDNVKPKFNIGNWITNGCLHYKITDVLENHYIVDTEFAKKNIIPIRQEKYYHLWTIQDAKDGDVLVDVIDERPFIFKGLLDHRHPDCPVAYCGIDLGRNFRISDDNSWWTYKMVNPATKEQRDTLMKAMTDEGWEFDFDKKELKNTISERTY